MNVTPPGPAGSASDAPPTCKTPALDCDLVMKGGLTSGVVYPKAVARVARDYQIRKIGGTSVGAIAAALTAAAEYYRTTQREESERQWDVLNVEIARDLASPRDTSFASDLPGFAGLYAIPADIGSNLVQKFQPALTLKEVFEYFLGIIRYQTIAGKLASALLWRLFFFRSVFAMLFLFIALWIRVNSDIAFSYAVPGLILLLPLSALPFVLNRLPEQVRQPLQRMPRSQSFLLRGVAVIAVFVVVYLVRRLLGYASGPLTLGEVFYPIPDIVEQLRDATDGGSAATTQEARENRYSIFIGAVAIVVGWIVGGFVALLYYLIWPVKANFLGICTGLGDKDALTNWLTGKIDHVAGLESGNAPLTFRQLQDQGISFEAITSDVTRGVPLDLPRALGRYSFKPAEFGKFFPGPVLQKLVNGRTPDDDGRLPFPDPLDIPIVVAARMSMSFPVLFSAVPVYYEDKETANQRNGDPFRQCWLSDGGIVSNFPVHKFDSALPRCPTFAFDLIQKQDAIPSDTTALTSQVSTRPIVRPEEKMEREMVDLQRISAPKMLDLVGLLSGIVNTSRGWVDNSQKTLPGYAERIVGIHLYQGEGGLNLAMTSQTIERLARRGLFGADHLVETWNPAVPDSEWHQHRWLRYRTMMRELEELGNEWRRVFGSDTPPAHSPSIATIVSDYSLSADLFYRWHDLSASTNGRHKNELFRKFVNDQVAEPPTIPVFAQQRIPRLNPKLFTIPPFE